MLPVFERADRIGEFWRTEDLELLGARSGAC
jgi:hypothetical protein